MKTKKLFPLFAVIAIMTVFLLPVTAYAKGDEPPEYIADYELPDDWDMEAILNDDDICDTIESDLPVVEKPFTPDGQATVVDLAYEGDGKMFYTFKTPAGNVFYLVIDHQRNADNVYFLNAVTEQDLLSLAENSGNSGSTSTSAIPTPTPPPTELNPDEEEKTDDVKMEDVTPPTQEKNNNGTLIFLVIGMAAVGGAGYYIKIVRPKQQADYEDEDEPDDDEEMEFEDEPDDETDDNEDYEDYEDVEKDKE